MSWRQGVEKDLDEVLQSQTVFTNVSKGQLANKEDLLKAFQTEDQKEVCLQILNKGELQISEKERSTQLESSFHEIANIVANKCVNPETKRPYPVSMIEKSMKHIHYSLKKNRTSKQQALEVIKLLQGTLPLERAQMKLKVLSHKKLKEQIEGFASKVENIEISDNGNMEITFLSDPGNFRTIDQLLKSVPKSQLHILSLCEIGDEEEASLEC